MILFGSKTWVAKSGVLVHYPWNTTEVVFPGRRLRALTGRTTRYRGRKHGTNPLGPKYLGCIHRTEYNPKSHRELYFLLENTTLLCDFGRKFGTEEKIQPPGSYSTTVHDPRRHRNFHCRECVKNFFLKIAGHLPFWTLCSMTNTNVLNQQLASVNENPACASC